MAGMVALHAFMVAGRTAAAAISAVWVWAAGLIGSGLTAIVKKVISKFKKEDKEEEVRDLEGFELDLA